jgi:hypothetical protein
MRGDGVSIGRDPPDEPGGEPSPQVVQRMTVVQAGAETGEPEHVALDIQAAIHKGLADAQLIEPAQRAQALAILHQDLHRRLGVAKAIGAAAPQANFQRDSDAIAEDPLLNQASESIGGRSPENGCALAHRECL